MQNKNKSIVETYLSRNKEDYIYNRCREIIEETDVETFKKVQNIYNGGNSLKSALKTLKAYYTDGADLMDYYNNILSVLGKGNLDLGAEIFDTTMLKVAADIEKRLGIHIIKVKHILLCLTLYKPYLGFQFEEMIRELLETNGFIVEENETLDNTYKIDLLVSLKDYKDYKIGLQLKSESYMYISSYTKQPHLKGQQKAIKEGICKDVYYLLHSLGQTVGRLYDKEFICNRSSNVFNAALKEYNTDVLIEDITKEILMYYLTDNYKNSFMLGVTDVIIDKEYKKFLEKKKSLSILPIDKLN